MRFKLIETERGLSLLDTERSVNPLTLSFDTKEFSRRLAGAGKKSEVVARAVKAGPGVRVLDCTAGLGRDGFVLAHLGCEVTMLERSVVLSILLRDALARAASNASLKPVVERMRLKKVDAKEYLQNLHTSDCPFDVIYIDPMFPTRDKSAEVKGEMQYLQHFIGKDEDAEALLELALSLPCQRVVLKRPAKSDWRSPVPPVHTFKGKASQFEVFNPAQL